MALPLELRRDLELLLSDARRFGFLGPGPVADQLARSLAFASVIGEAPNGLAVDVGSGGGLPGLVLAVLWPMSEWLLVDSNGRRAGWLREALEELRISSRVEVRCQRAELTGRSRYRHSAELVTARGFGPPGPTAECAAPLLRVGGHLLVADRPAGQADRWPRDGLAELGLQLESSEVVVTGAGPVSISRIISVSNCGPRYPRRVGVPFKRPLF
jgi:16S rRNA (guanine527-N7)-methyltransferase